MSKQQTREIMELAAVFAMLGGLLGFVHEQATAPHLDSTQAV
jgi:hypothetical protein